MMTLFSRLCAYACSTALIVSAGSALADPARFERFTYAGKSQEQAKPGSGEYLNPILSGYYPDPSITRVGDDYYLINSSFSHFPGIPVFHSKDLVNWTQIGNAIDRTEQLNFKGLEISAGVFAPDISYHDGLFYIVNTCIACKGNFVITAKDPKGPWSNPVWFAFEGIDPSIFWDTDGKAYMVNNGAPNETPRYDGHRAIWVQEFDFKNMKLVGERTQIVNGGVDITKKPIWIEGPHIYKKDDYYYMSAAEGGTGDWHSQVVFRSKSVRGPFIPYDKNPILSQRTLDPNRPHPITSAGHAKLVQTQNGEWWATFLATRPYSAGNYNIGRETFLLPVTWKDGWPVILDDGKTIPFTAKKPNLPGQPRPANPVNGDITYTDEFNGTSLSMAWIGMRTPQAPLYSLNKGALVLNSGAPIGDITGVPGFVGRRQQHHVATVVTTLSYTPEKDGDRAGLVAVQNDKSYLFYGVTEIDGKTVLALYARENTGAERLVASTPIKAKGATLIMRLNGGLADFDYKIGDKTKTLTSAFDVTFLSTRASGGFVGTLIGPYAYQKK
jgi:xylan 1,4-beta-xylosidase